MRVTSTGGWVAKGACVGAWTVATDVGAQAPIKKPAIKIIKNALSFILLLLFPRLSKMLDAFNGQRNHLAILASTLIRPQSKAGYQRRSYLTRRPPL
jgi:hypothetical protein